jgi:hypothetical protein
VRLPPWYTAVERRLEPSAPLMIGIVAVMTIISLLLIARRKWVLLSAWLAYLLMP